MFQNTYQNGTYFDLFDPKTSADKVKNLYKVANVPGNNKIFDKDLKTYVLEFNSPNAKISFPREDRKDLYLIQQFLNFQIFFFPGMSWNIELAVSDLNKTKRRINLSSATHKFEKKTFFVKYPCPFVKEGLWNNFVVDLYSFINAFKGQSYRSLDAIHISGHFKLRRIFTTHQPLQQSFSTEEVKPITFLPKNFYFPPTVDHTTFLLNYEEESFIEEAYEPTETSTKNASNFKHHREISISNTTNLAQSKKNDKIGYKGQKKFLANTNGAEMKSKKITDNISSEKSEFTETKSKTPAKTDKNIRKGKSVGKPTVPKNRTSIEKRKNLQEEKNKVKGKLNPWRTSNSKDIHTDGGNSQFSNSKIEEVRQVESAQTTLFQTKNNLVSKFNESKKQGCERKSDYYSDSDYIQLSQKFSTVTDGKFFKNELASQHLKRQMEEDHAEDEIEENIEMESNSVCSSADKKKVEEAPHELFNEKQIDESISDSLDNYNTSKKEANFNKSIMRNSHYGFGEKMMNKFMSQLERPYSPPLGERELTEHSERNDEQDDKEVQLIYDPVLNCYYDHKTHTYYELKN